MKKHILCYGDSNTFGVDPAGDGRLPDETRWTGVLQELLGDGYRVIEEGLNGRTTVFEDETSYGRCGLKMLTPCIASHNPLDLIIVMLGTNDLKQLYNLTPADLNRAIGRIIDEIRFFQYEPYPVPEILIVSPVLIKSGVSRTFGRFTEKSVELSRHFSEEYAAACSLKGCRFFDAAGVAEASDEDKLHMNASNHRLLAESLAKEITRILG